MVQHNQLLDIDGFMQERLNSIANALELHLSCTNPSICAEKEWQLYVPYIDWKRTWKV